jgi:hypothetical protein
MGFAGIVINGTCSFAIAARACAVMHPLDMAHAAGEGAVAAALTLCNEDMVDMSVLYERERHDVRSMLDRELPHDAHLMCSCKLVVSLLHFGMLGCSVRTIGFFATREDLVDVLVAAIYVPMYTDRGAWATACFGRYCAFPGTPAYPCDGHWQVVPTKPLLAVLITCMIGGDDADDPPSLGATDTDMIVQGGGLSCVSYMGQLSVMADAHCVRRFYGTSAGAIMAALEICGIRGIALVRAADEFERIFCTGRWALPAILEVLDTCLPQDAHVLCSDRLVVCLARVPYLEPIEIHAFKTRDDLLAVLRAACLIPYVTAPQCSQQVGEHRYVDGVFARRGPIRGRSRAVSGSTVRPVVYPEYMFENLRFLRIGAMRGGFLREYVSNVIRAEERVALARRAATRVRV